MIHVQLTHQMIEEVAEQYHLEFDDAEEMVQTIVGSLTMNRAIEYRPAEGGSKLIEYPAWVSLSWTTKAGEVYEFVLEPSVEHPLAVEFWGKPGLQKLETVQIKGEPAYISQPDLDQVSITLRGARVKQVES